MAIHFFENQGVFHLTNAHLSYILHILPNGHLGQLYFGSAIPIDEDYRYLFEGAPRPMTTYVFEGDTQFSLEHTREEYPVYGHSDYRSGACRVVQPNGASILNLEYVSHMIQHGKPALPGLPACRATQAEAQTLEILLKDQVSGLKITLSYTIYEELPMICRHAEFKNDGVNTLRLQKAFSLALDLPDDNWLWHEFVGAWSRERHLFKRPLTPGMTAIGSTRGHSSHQFNPFVCLTRSHTTEHTGQAIGCSFVYSGNFLIQAEVDAYHTTRLLCGIHPENFEWALRPGESFVTPEAVLGYSTQGLNGLSQAFHNLMRNHLSREPWGEMVRPLLVNNWEGTYFDFTEEKLLGIAQKAKDLGLELFVLDDGWFGERTHEKAGLGDWWPNTKRLKNGIAGLSQKIRALGLKFGLWFEPEMCNQDSDLYRNHPDWILQTPGYSASHGRHQYVLDFSRQEVIDYIYQLMEQVIRDGELDYIKWDMNRSLSEVYSTAYPPHQQGEIFHRHILGVYQLHQRLLDSFPQLLIEGCSSGGGRFDPGMLPYCPQIWTSDDTDAIERLFIQHGTSYAYPISCIGAHVSVSPNHQVLRHTPLFTRAAVALFGTFGYELDLMQLSDDTCQIIKREMIWVKIWRCMIQHGQFTRLRSPFEGNDVAWAAMDLTKSKGVVGYYRILNRINDRFDRLPLPMLNDMEKYRICEVAEDFSEERPIGQYSGKTLKEIGILLSDPTAGEISKYAGRLPTDFYARLFTIEKIA